MELCEDRGELLLTHQQLPILLQIFSGQYYAADPMVLQTPAAIKSDVQSKQVVMDLARLSSMYNEVK